jgi:beta-lactamase class A
LRGTIAPSLTINPSQMKRKKRTRRQYRRTRDLATLAVLLGGAVLGSVYLASGEDVVQRLERPAGGSPPQWATAPGSWAASLSGPLSLENQLREIAADHLGAYGVVVFDPASRARVAINEDAAIEAASVAKLYTMLALYRAAERGEVDLEEEVAIAYGDHAAYGTGVLHNHPAGHEMTLRECAEYLIRESDNTAWVMLNRHLGEEEIQAEIEALGLRDTDYANFITTPGDVMTALRAIADPSVTTEELSAEMISHMTDTAYEDRIPEPLPPETRVAHKIGSYGTTFSDAGIVFPESGGHYFLVVMATGTTEEEAREAIQEMSLATYRALAR